MALLPNHFEQFLVLVAQAKVSPPFETCCCHHTCSKAITCVKARHTNALGLLCVTIIAPIA